MKILHVVMPLVLVAALGGAMAGTPDGVSTSRKPNHLIHEKSPYLLQHAFNPVDWYPWGDAAFAKAKAENKPIFLSIGYATCHWCHVMEHECFEDPEVAALMNATFVNIKVDREERPDIDQVYMTVCRMLTGSGGWPLTIIMTPGQQPFFAGTFLPKHGRFGRPGLMELIPRVADMWTHQRAELESSAAGIMKHLEHANAARGGPVASASTLDAAEHELAVRFDAEHGGFGTAPKFPAPHTLVFLLRQWRRTGDVTARDMATTTLAAMRDGGIWDHIGGGFHRYSTDARWQVPHFEKMLYDQATLALAYLEAYEATRNRAYAATARDILAYVERDLGAPAGGFSSAEDADSEGVEGTFYLWMMPQLQRVLDADELRVAVTAWNIDPDGNFGDAITGESDGTNILYRTASNAEIAGRLHVDQPRVEALLKSARRKLFEARSRRVRPLLDDKVLTDWNGLTIAALARAGLVLGEPKYTGRAQAAAAFLLSHLRDQHGQLLHRWRDGQAAIGAMLDDYAFLAWGMIELYEATFDPRWLREAMVLASQADDSFSAPAGGFYLTASDAERLLVRPRDGADTALPSGSSVMLDVLLRLSRLTGNERWADRADALIHALSAGARRSPTAYTAFLAALTTLHAPTWEIVVAGEGDDPAVDRMLKVIRGIYLPGTTVLLLTPDDRGRQIRSLAPFTRSMHPAEGGATAYVCRDGACDLPLNSSAALRQKLMGASPSAGKDRATEARPSQR